MFVFSSLITIVGKGSIKAALFKAFRLLKRRKNESITLHVIRTALFTLHACRFCHCRHRLEDKCALERRTRRGGGGGVGVYVYHAYGPRPRPQHSFWIWTLRHPYKVTSGRDRGSCTTLNFVTSKSYKKHSQVSVLSHRGNR